MGIQIKGSNDTISASDGSMVLEGSALTFDNESITGISTMATGHITGTATIDDDLKVGISTLFVDKSTGKTGIGTAIPGEKLSVEDSSPAVLINATNASGESKLQFGRTGNTNVGEIKYEHSNNAFTFRTNDSADQLRIDSSGRVLIGHTSSLGEVWNSDGGSLQVAGTSYLNSTFQISRWTNSASCPHIIMGKSRGGAVGTNVVVQDGDTAGIIAFAADDGTDLLNAVAEIRAQIDGTPGSNDTPGRLIFSTTADGSNSRTEHLRIDQAGKITIGGGIQDQEAASFNSGANQLLITSNGATGLTIDATSSTSSSIHFADGATGSESYRGIIEYNHGSDYMSFATSGSHRLKLEDGDLTLNGPEGISANLYLIADEGDDDGDGWRIGSNQDTNDLTFANNTSGSYVDKMCLKNDGKLSFNGDEDTFITRSGTNTLQIETNGTLCTEFSANQRVRMPQVYSTNGSSMNDVQIESDGTLCAGNTSIRASKKNIVSQTDVSWLYDLNPVTFNYRKKNVDEETGEHTYLEEAESETSYGLIAEEVESVKKDFVFYTNDELAGVYYKQLITPLLKAVQEHKKEIEILKTEIAALKSS